MTQQVTSEPRGTGSPRVRAPRNSAERAHRDEQIIRARAAGRSVREVAERFGVTERHVYRIASYWRDAQAYRELV